jgi:hypothetical protein
VRETALGALGAQDERALAALIRAGEFDGRGPELRAALRSLVRAKLEVANPRYLAHDPDPPSREEQ